MKIEGYINASRRCLPPSPTFQWIYRSYYDSLKLQLPHGPKYPELIVVYSTDRLTERASMDGREFIVFDQNLGQAFNHLNKILYARNSQVELTWAYAFKFFAQQLAVRQCIKRATVYAAAHCVVRDQTRTKKPFRIKAERELTRASLIYVQELFVLAHELAHYLFDQFPKERLNELCSKSYDEAAKLIQRKPTTAALEAIAKRYGSKSAELLRDDAGRAEYEQRRLKYLEESRMQLTEEFYCDKVAAYLALRCAVSVRNMRPEIAAEGIYLAFKYVRFFDHLRQWVRILEDLAHAVTDDERKDILQSMNEGLWSGKDGNLVIGTQLREQLLRNEICDLAAGFGEMESGDINRHLADIADEYDRTIEAALLLELPERISSFETERPPLERHDFKGKSDTELLQDIDHMTGWDEEALAKADMDLTGAKKFKIKEPRSGTAR